MKWHCIHVLQKVISYNVQNINTNWVEILCLRITAVKLHAVCNQNDICRHSLNPRRQDIVHTCKPSEFLWSLGKLTLPQLNSRWLNYVTGTGFGKFVYIRKEIHRETTDLQFAQYGHKNTAELNVQLTLLLERIVLALFDEMPRVDGFCMKIPVRKTKCCCNQGKKSLQTTIACIVWVEIQYTANRSDRWLYSCNCEVTWNSSHQPSVKELNHSQ